MTELDKENQDPAYRCGRMLAVLERIQQLAIPGAGSTITDRFYGTFSSAPASVVGVLLRKSQTHLAKLRKEKPAQRASKANSKKSKLPCNPSLRTLTLEQQGLFGLGYYHQRAKTVPTPSPASSNRKRPRPATNRHSALIHPQNHFSHRKGFL